MLSALDLPSGPATGSKSLDTIPESSADEPADTQAAAPAAAPQSAQGSHLAVSPRARSSVALAQQQGLPQGPPRLSGAGVSGLWNKTSAFSRFRPSSGSDVSSPQPDISMRREAGAAQHTASVLGGGEPSPPAKHPQHDVSRASSTASTLSGARPEAWQRAASCTPVRRDAAAAAPHAVFGVAESSAAEPSAAAESEVDAPAPAGAQAAAGETAAAAALVAPAAESQAAEAGTTALPAAEAAAATPLAESGAAAQDDLPSQWLRQLSGALTTLTDASRLLSLASEPSRAEVSLCPLKRPAKVHAGQPVSE